ncbi:extracellular solute-binding protein [Oerskovia sp. M15]
MKPPHRPVTCSPRPCGRSSPARRSTWVTAPRSSTPAMRCPRGRRARRRRERVAHPGAGRRCPRCPRRGRRTFLTDVGTDAGADFAAGIFASTIGSTGSLTGLLEAAPFELGTAYLPDGPSGSGTPTGGTGLAIPASRTPEQQLAAAMFLAFLTEPENTAYFSQNTGYMPVRTSAVEGETMSSIYAATPQFRTAVDQLAEKSRTQDWVRVFVPGGDQILTDGIEQIVLKGTPATEAFASITPRLEKAYQENVVPYL